MSRSKLNYIDLLMLILIITSIFFISETLAVTPCADGFNQKDGLLVTYKIDSQSNLTAKQSSILTLVRTKDHIVYSSSGIVEVWEHTADNQIKQYKYFEQDQRGVEYQTIDLVNTSRFDWQSKRQLVSNDYLQNFELVKQKRKGCKKFQKYTRSIPSSNGEMLNESLRLVWHSQLNIPERLEHKKREHKKYRSKTSWKLIKLETKQENIAAYMSRLNRFDVIEYSDIRDNEFEQFSQKGIDFGFLAPSEKSYHISQIGIHSESESKNGHAH